MREVIFVSIAAFIAWFVDAVAGGGGLIQIPALFIAYPNTLPALLLGTNKIPAFFGTSLAAYSYVKRQKIDWQHVGVWMLTCGLCAIGGSYLVSVINPEIVKPIILVMLIVIAVYTYATKNLWAMESLKHTGRKHLWMGIFLAAIMGFYDGFLWPGSGNLLIMGFITIIWFDFLKASTHAKLLNLSSNFWSILLFGSSGLVRRTLVIPMTICNLLGSWLGTHMAFLKWNTFIRKIFIWAISLAILRYAWDIFV